ncbi:MAG: cysteine desulfurase NifS [Firmicutes bacterium]|nr:cysteine desulfurase NifS [Bacillota bacterium]
MARIYLDHAATTPVDPRVVKAMIPYLTGNFGNPSSIYQEGRAAKKAVEESREKVAEILGAADAREIIFTGSGSEANNLAIAEVAWAYRKRGNHIITSAIEHHAVLETCKALEKHGFTVTYLPVDEYGLVAPEAVREAITDRTILVSLMYANNEVGTIQPIVEISKTLQEKRVLFHTDAVQTVGSIPLHLKELGVDLLSLSAHKFYGPKGTGALYVKKGTRLHRLIHGGAQERRLRAGTENVAGIVGMAKALELAVAGLEETVPRLVELRDYFISQLVSRIDHVKLNGHPTRRLPGNINVSFEFVEGESILLNLDRKGVAASSGSACTSGSLDPSHVLLAMGLSHETAHGSLRLTLGKENTKEQLDYVLGILEETITRLREISPLYLGQTAERRI